MRRREGGKELESPGALHKPQHPSSLPSHPLAIPPHVLSQHGALHGAWAATPLFPAVPRRERRLFFFLLNLIVTRFAGSVFTWCTQLCQYPPNLQGVTKCARPPLSLLQEEVGAPPRETERPTSVSVVALGSWDPHFCVGPLLALGRDWRRPPARQLVEIPLCLLLVTNQVRVLRPSPAPPTRVGWLWRTS